MTSVVEENVLRLQLSVLWDYKAQFIWTKMSSKKQYKSVVIVIVLLRELLNFKRNKKINKPLNVHGI